MKKYLISLEKDNYRRELFFSQLDTNDFEVFSAINTMQQEWGILEKQFDIAQFEKRYQRKVTKGEIGCTLSHLAIYRKIVEDNTISEDEYCLICEDDALFNKNFNGVIQQILHQEKKTDIILVGQSKIANFKDIELEINYPITFSFLAKKIDNTTFNIAYPYKDYFVGTVAYLIKKSAARTFISKASFHQLPFWLADDFILFHSSFNLSNKVIRPLLAIENPKLTSNLEAIRGSIPHNFALKLMKYPLKKLFAFKRNIGV